MTLFAESGWLHRRFADLDRLARRLVPAELNPFVHTGAIATLAFLIAAVSGVLTLIWYKSSVHEAYASVEAMTSATWTGGLVRSIHRYSSDLCVFFGVIHALKLFAARRFRGPRWLAWVTGLALIGTLWFVGWLGYWLVWDQRAVGVAVGSARLVDIVPIFAEPLTRSFLTNESTNSLLFFMVFFMHMLIPLAMGVLLWLHIVRVNRSRFLTNRILTFWVTGALFAASIAWPAVSAAPADLALSTIDVTMDWWYLFPLVVTETVSPFVLWGAAMFVGFGLAAFPWLPAKRKAAAAEVVPDRCDACYTCFHDCPFGAVEMVPRPGGTGKLKEVASVDPARCVSCGICTGSCDKAGIGIPVPERIEFQRLQDSWLKIEAEKPLIAYACESSAGAGLTVDPITGECEQLPGYRTTVVPCIGWVHAKTVERAIKRGAPGVLLVACGEGNCAYREGAQWTEQRMAGVREPFVRPTKVASEQMLFAHLDAGDRRLTDIAAAFREARRTGGPNPSVSAPGRAGVFGATVLALVIGVLTVFVSDMPFAPPAPPPSLVVTFNHPGVAGEHCRTLSPEEQAKQPAHMRRTEVCERGRAPVRLRVLVDGEVKLEKSFAPGGIREDGRSVALERLEIAPGRHDVRVEIGDTWAPDDWPYSDEKSIELAPERRAVVLFEQEGGFQWH